MIADHTKPGPLADVTVDDGGGRWTLVLVRTLRHPPEKVWGALTDPRRLPRWAPFAPDRDLSRTGDATLRMVDGDQVEAFPARVTRAEPPTLLEYTWGDDLLRWELEASETGTRLTLRHTVEERDTLPKVAAGWHLCLDVAERLLDGLAVDPVVGEDAKNHGWHQLHDAYAAALGLGGCGRPQDAEQPGRRDGSSLD